MAFNWDEHIRQTVEEFNRRLATSQPLTGYAEGGTPKPAGIIPGPVTPGGGDNTLTPTQTGEYIIPVDAVMAIGKGVAPNSQLSPEDAMAIGKQILDDRVAGLKRAMGNDTPPRNAGIAAPTGFAEGGQVGSDFPVAGKDFPVAGAGFPVAGADFPKAGLPQPAPQPTPQPRLGYKEGGMNMPGEEKPLDTTPPPVTPPAGIHPANPNAVLLKVGAGQTDTGYEKAATITNGNVDKYAGLNQARGVIADKPNNLPDLANSVKSIKETASGTDIVNDNGTSPMVTMRGTMDPKAAGILHNKVGWSAGSQNMTDFANNEKYKEQVGQAVRANAVLGNAPDDRQIKALNMSPTDVTTLLAANDKDGRFDPAIKAGLETARTKAIADNNKAMMGLKQEGMNIKKQEADIKEKRVDQLGNTPSAYKDFRAGIEAKLRAQGITDPGEISRKVSDEYKQWSMKSGMGNSRGTQAFNTKTGKVEPVTWEQHNSNPGQYVSAADPNVKALANDVKQYDMMSKSEKQAQGAAKLLRESSKAYSRSGIKFVNSMEALGRAAVNDPKLADLHMKLLSFSREYYKVTTGAYASAAELSIGAQQQADKLLNASDSYASLEAKISAAEQEMKNSKVTFQQTIDERKKSLGWEEPAGQSAGLTRGSSVPPEIQESGRLMAKDMHSKNWASEAFQKRVYDNFRSKGYTHEQINQIGEIAARLK